VDVRAATIDGFIKCLTTNCSSTDCELSRQYQGETVFNVGTDTVRSRKFLREIHSRERDAYTRQRFQAAKFCAQTAIHWILGQATELVPRSEAVASAPIFLEVDYLRRRRQRLFLQLPALRVPPPSLGAVRHRRR
jgi:hypothetical protein